MSKSLKSFIQGSLIGGLAGAVAGLLFAPKSGKELRKDIANKAEDAKEMVIERYDEVKAMLEEKVQNVRDAGGEINREHYEELVNQVVAQVQKDKKLTADLARKLGSQLRSDWNIVKKAIQS